MPDSVQAVHSGAFQGPFRVRYRQWISDIRVDIGAADLLLRENFHHALHMLSRLGLNQVEFAREHGYQPSTVNRWVNGQKAPPRQRRPPIVNAALKMLLDNVKAADEAGDPGKVDTDWLELRSIAEDDAPAAKRIASGG